MRYHPLSNADRDEMRHAIGVADIAELFADMPGGVVENFDLPRGKSEIEVERHLARLAAKNLPASEAPFFVGAGAYRHHVPASVDHLIQRSEFLTSYTPYQPEISQGTLQYLFEFQTQVATLDRHGDRQRLDVRRLHRLRRSDADGASHHQAAQGAALGRAASAIRRGRAHRGAARRRRDRGARAGRDGGRGFDRPNRRQPLLRNRADAGFLRQSSRSSRCRRRLPSSWRAADRGVHRGRVAGSADLARRHGRRYCRRRRPVDRQCAQFRRPLCRAVRDTAGIPAPDAGAPLRRDGRRWRDGAAMC